LTRAHFPPPGPPGAIRSDPDLAAGQGWRGVRLANRSGAVTPKGRDSPDAPRAGRADGGDAAFWSARLEWPNVSFPVLNLIVALGAGLLIGAERERASVEHARPTVAGIRTFAVAAVAGAVALAAAGVTGLATATAAVTAMVGLSYWRTRDDHDPGITTEIALVLTVLVGALAMQDPAAAAAVSVTVALLLAARKGVHHFVSSVLSEAEVRAALILGAAVIVVLPLLPNQAVGPFDALNPYSIWRLVVLVLAIGATGHVAVRVAGPRFGLPVAGLASGFVSSSATIGAMGSRAAKSPRLLGAATAGAVLSTVATVIQMAAVVGATSAPTLKAMSASLIFAGVAAAAYGAVFTVRALHQAPVEADEPGQAFSLSAAIVFAVTLSAVLLGSAALREWFGEAGAIAAAGLAGFVDTHAPAISIAALVAAGKMSPGDAVIPILVGLSTNTVTKLVVAVTSGGRRFAIRVIPGLILVLAGAWAGAWAGVLATRAAG
jgi:uncharacterized membrane protein (DUF4010 family)